MDHLVKLANELRLGRLTIEQFRARLIQSLSPISADELPLSALEYNDIDSDDWRSDVTELRATDNYKRDPGGMEK